MIISFIFASSIFFAFFFFFLLLCNLQEEMQSRYQAQINLLQAEVDQRDDMIIKLQRQLQMIGGIRADSPIPQLPSPLHPIDCQSEQFQELDETRPAHAHIINQDEVNEDENAYHEDEGEDGEDEEDDDEFPSNYFAVRI